MNMTAEGVVSAPNLLSNLWSAQRIKILAVTLVLFFGLALFVFFGIDFFYVYDLDVTGIQNLTQREVENASGVMTYSIFYIDPHSVELALAKLPEVKSVRVSTSLPHHVAVDIEERSPIISWLRGTETYWVDADGIAMKARPSQPQPQMLAVRDLDQNTVKLGQHILPDALSAVCALVQVWPDSPQALEWSAAKGLAFSDDRGWKIYMGNANDMAGKVAELRVITAQLVAKGAKIKFIDLGKGDPYFQ